jgi:hypothetical protein
LCCFRFIAPSHSWIPLENFFEGTEDFNTPIEPAYAYFEQVKAPRKEFVLFKGGDHFIPLDRPDEFLTRLIEYIRPLVFSAKDEPIEPTIRKGQH